MTKLLGAYWLLVVLLSLSSTAIYASSVGTLDGSPVNLPPGMLVANRVTPSPHLLLTLLFFSQLGGLVLIGLPHLIYRGLRRKWPQSSATRHRVIVFEVTATVVLAALAIMSLNSTIRAKEVLFLFVGCLAGYTVMWVADFLVVRRVWRRFAQLPRYLRPVVVFMLPLFVMWLVVAMLQAWVQQTIHTYPVYKPIVSPDFGQETPLPPSASPLQPTTQPQQHLILPPEAQE